MSEGVDSNAVLEGRKTWYVLERVANLGEAKR